MKTSPCRSCRAPILWATTISGNKMPLDPEPTPAGTWRVERIDGDPTCSIAPPGYEGDTYQTHWATCPTADLHRRGR